MSLFNEVIEIIEIFNAVAGVLLNLLLIYIIRRFSGPLLGTYKHLLTIFASLDFYLAVIHYFVHPRVLRVDNTHSVVSENRFDDMRVTAFWIGCQSMPFTLLGIHFLYRYWSVRRPHLIALFSNKYFVSFLVSFTLGGLVSWYFLCYFTASGHDNTLARSIMIAEYERKYGRRVENAWILMDQWRDGQYDVDLITITSLMNVEMICSVIFSTTLGVLIFQHIRNSYKMSVQTTELQHKLFVTLIAQSAVPMIFVYLPYIICINNSFLNIPGTFFHEFCSTAFTFFPVWDPIIVIILFSDYRRGVTGIFRKPTPITPTTMYISSTVVRSISEAPTRAIDNY